MGREFLGCYDLFADQLLFMERSDGGRTQEGIACDGLEDSKLDELLTAEAVTTLRDNVEMARGLCADFDLKSYREGHLTPVFFGSAINNFGVQELLKGVASLAPSPRPQTAKQRTVEPEEEKVTAFVFKIQANMDLKHRDRVAFVRICSGHFRKGLKLKHMRSGKTMSIHNPMLFLAQDRGVAEEAWAGDIIGIPNHGALRIGDTLTESEELHFTGIPSFAPELLQRIRSEDPLRVKHLGRTLIQLGEEGAARVFKTRMGSEWIVGVLGALQFEILGDRIRTEYGIPVRFEAAPYVTARWLDAAEPRLLKQFADANQSEIAEDHDGGLVFLARNNWRLDDAAKEWKDISFLATKEQT